MPDKIGDWVQIMGGKLVENVKDVMMVNPEMSTKDALERVLADSCAGPGAIKLAKESLGI
jgi:hypothetical protein